MFFSDDMNFQYFFFDTYLGYFLQMLPFSLIVGAVYGFVRFHRDQQTPVFRKAMSILLVCYITGLVGLVALLDVIRDLWYQLIYQMDSGRSVIFWSGDFNFVPDFWQHLRGETVANLAMFVPFGVLYPLSKENRSWKSTMIAGVACTMVIELLQPIFGRAFDINDIIMNTMGVLLAATIFFGIKKGIEA